MDCQGPVDDHAKYAEPSIEDYAERTKQTIANWNRMNGKQGARPVQVLFDLAECLA